MKKLLLYIILFICIMCSPQKKSSEIIETLRDSETKKGVKKDTFFLGFTFGMSEKQVNEKFIKLLSENKIISNSDHTYGYNMQIDWPVKIKTTFTPEYLNDSLYSFSLNMEGESGSQSEAGLIQISVVSLYSQKYSYNNQLRVPSMYDKGKIDYVFIFGNQQININYPSLTTAVRVQYFDYKMQARKYLMDYDAQKKKEEKTIKDL